MAPTPDSLGEWLLAAPPGRASELLGADTASIRAALDGVGATRLGVIVPLDALAPASAVAERVLAGLAEAARQVFPHWYGGNELIGVRASPSEEALLAARLRAVQGRLPDVSAAWAAGAARRVLDGGKRMPEAAPAVMARQLALALNGGAVTIVPVASRDLLPAETLPFAAAMSWLARASGAAVVAATRRPTGRLPCETLRVTAAPEPEAAVVWAGPVAGRPHPGSEAEQRLAKAIGEDAMLAPLFACNQTVATARGTTPRVDVLWRAGRLAIEIDGFADHGTRDAFARDRRRDFDLLVSGYAVIRLTNDEVLTDLPLVLDKVRHAVKVRAGIREGA